MDTSRVTRLELIDDQGVALTSLGVHVRLALQDDGKTLKIFTAERREKFEWDYSGWEVRS